MTALRTRSNSSNGWRSVRRLTRSTSDTCPKQSQTVRRNRGRPVACKEELGKCSEASSSISAIWLRCQRPGEPFKMYLLEIRLMMCLAGYTEAQGLKRAYENLLPEYQLFVRRSDVRTLRDLTVLTTNYEVTRKREQCRRHWSPYTEGTQHHPFRTYEPVEQPGGS